MDEEEYTYATSGFDSFLSRSIDNLYQNNLDSQGPVSTQMRYDSSQLSGAIGDIFKIGNIVLNGRDSTITLTSEGENAKIVIDGNSKKIQIFDNNNSRVLIGNLPDNTFGWAVSIPERNVENGFVN